MTFVQLSDHPENTAAQRLLPFDFCYAKGPWYSNRYNGWDIERATIRKYVTNFKLELIK
jgi:hypothetical protein